MTTLNLVKQHGSCVLRYLNLGLTRNDEDSEGVVRFECWDGVVIETGSGGVSTISRLFTTLMYKTKQM